MLLCHSGQVPVPGLLSSTVCLNDGDFICVFFLYLNMPLVQDSLLKNFSVVLQINSEGLPYFFGHFV